MKNISKFTGYDASEGALYVLFMFCLAMHPQTPSIFAIDSFDHTLNPRLAKKMTQIFCEEILKNEKHVFIITHNPLVLDGLDLINEGQPLSKLWVNGRLEGI